MTQDMLNQAWPLAPDNFTPPQRTPWGGIRIVDHYKPALYANGKTKQVGESWEISVEPDFPSTLADRSKSLIQALKHYPSALGKEHTLGREGTALLVKLLDAADDLSVQIHPSDDYAGLSGREAGKPESWYILEASEGAGLYLGFKDGVEKSDVAQRLEEQGDLSELMQFVPVSPGDFFLIEAGTPHAIGKGITLIEPQHVIPGKRGLTYRFWDWNRRYNSAGMLDPGGVPRSLHVDHALAVTQWDRVTGPRLIEGIRHRSGMPLLTAPAVLTSLSNAAGASGALASSHLAVSRIAGSGTVVLDDSDTLRGVTLVAGQMQIQGRDGTPVSITRGMSAVLPATMRGISLTCDGAHALLTSVILP